MSYHLKNACLPTKKSIIEIVTSLQIVYDLALYKNTCLQTKKSIIEIVTSLQTFLKYEHELSLSKKHMPTYQKLYN